jgi:RNA recognition motif-containing protein
MDSSNWRVKRDPAESSAREQTQNRSFQQRQYDTDRKPGSSPNASRFPQNQASSRDTIRKPFNDAQAEQAIEEGRRVYVGNLPYEATVKDIEKLFKDVASEIQAINMSVDPMTGRNPSYCFVDFTSKELAQRVMQEYNGQDFLRRPLKVKPGVKSGTGTGRYDVVPRTRQSDTAVVFDRWRRLETPEELDGAVKGGRRLYIGGLPRFKDQEDTNLQMRKLFKDFQLEVVSKLLSSQESKRYKVGNHYYCFVDLGSREEASAAIRALDGSEKWGWNIKVDRSSGSSVKLAERRRLFVGGLPEFPDQEAAEAGLRELFEGYEIKEMSKLFSPSGEKMAEEGNHMYCFVELANEEQTDAAIEALDWKEMWSWKVRVKPATGNARKAPERSSQGVWRPNRSQE